MIVVLWSVVVCRFERVVKRIIAQTVARRITKQSKPENTVVKIGNCLRIHSVRPLANTIANTPITTLKISNICIDGYMS